MEFLEGRTLRQVIADKPLPPAEFIDSISFTLPVADALDAALESVIMGLDKSPAAIFLLPIAGA